MTVSWKLARAAACFFALVWSAPAAAAKMTYTFSGTLTGSFTVDGGPLISTGPIVQTSIILTGDAPGSDVAGIFTAVPLTSGFIGQLGPFSALDLPPSAVADFGKGPADGNAGFGFLLPTPMGLFGVAGPGLSNYDGSTSLGPVPVIFVGAGELFTHDAQHTYGLFIDGFTDATFSAAAAVPEPASWALMIIGFGAAGSVLRRRKPTVLKA